MVDAVGTQYTVGVTSTTARIVEANASPSEISSVAEKLGSLNICWYVENPIPLAPERPKANVAPRGTMR